MRREKKEKGDPFSAINFRALRAVKKKKRRGGDDRASCAQRAGN